VKRIAPFLAIEGEERVVVESEERCQKKGEAGRAKGGVGDKYFFVFSYVGLVTGDEPNTFPMLDKLFFLYK
jgi:hypothetical protein